MLVVVVTLEESGADTALCLGSAGRLSCTWPLRHIEYDNAEYPIDTENDQSIGYADKLNIL
jgi:hypothetical protein